MRTVSSILPRSPPVRAVRSPIRSGSCASISGGGAAATVEAAAACGIRRVVHLSSGSVYGASGRDVGLLMEDTPLRPEQLYASPKQASEAVALRLADLHRLDL